MVKLVSATALISLIFSVCVSARSGQYSKLQCVTEQLMSDIGEPYSRYYEMTDGPNNIRKTRIAMFKTWVEYDVIDFNNDGDLIVSQENYSFVSDQLEGSEVGDSMVACRRRDEEEEDVFDNASDAMDCVLDELRKRC